MKTTHPFSFVRDGKFALPTQCPFITVKGMKNLKNVELNAEEQKAVDALNGAAKSLMTETMYSPTHGNDDVSTLLTKVTDWEGNWEGEYYDTKKQCYVVIDLGSWTKTYTTEHGIEKITNHPNTWGWNALETLQPYSNTLRKLAKKHHVNIDVKMIERVRKYKEMFNAEEMSVRAPNSLSDFGRAEGFAVFMGTGYADFQWVPNTIEKAKLFGSESLARQAMENNRCRDGVVVKVETVIKEVCDTSATSDALRDALAALQKERLEYALQHAELETLRAHVARMENQTAPEAKRKM